MTITRFLSVALVASILSAGLPAVTYADQKEGDAAPTMNLRAAIDRAAVQHRTAQDLSIAPRNSSAAVSARQGMGGGGGKGALIWSVVGTAVGLGTTYYVIREMRKQTEQITGQQ